jgi:glyoxylase-like metal-dependent hydrolase (beta-lactamase superfamily II)
MTLHTIDTELFKLDGGAMFGVVPKTIWQKTNPADSNNLCTWAMRLLLIEDGNKLMLVDTGMGNKQDPKFLSHYYLHGNNTLDKSLAQLGFHKNDITDVFLTHLHFDHCGGAIEKVGDDLITAFKNAIYWSNESHWQWATEPNEREKASFLKENILPIKESGQLQMVGGRSIANSHWSLLGNGVPDVETELLNQPYLPSTKLDFYLANGHTESMMLPMIDYKGRTIVYMADLLPSVGHLPIPYVMGYDTRPLLTLQEKKAFLQQAVEKDYVLYFEHDPINECCTVQQTEKGVRVKETFKLSEL